MVDDFQSHRIGSRRSRPARGLRSPLDELMNSLPVIQISKFKNVHRNHRRARSRARG